MPTAVSVAARVAARRQARSAELRQRAVIAQTVAADGQRARQWVATYRLDHHVGPW